MSLYHNDEGKAVARPMMNREAVASAVLHCALKRPLVLMLLCAAWACVHRAEVRRGVDQCEWRCGRAFTRCEIKRRHDALACSQAYSECRRVCAGSSSE